VRIALAMAASFQANGGRIVTGARVDAWRNRADTVELGTTAGSFSARFVVCCAGLHADRLARLAGLRPDFRIVPFRGEFYRLPASFAARLAHHVYPVPDPSLPFLGVHMTRTVGGGAMVGPNAVLALHREGYRRRDFDARECAGLFAYGGLWRLAMRHWRAGLRELRTSWSARAYAAAARRYFPEVTHDILLECPAGVRAQAVSADGRLIDDFRILETPRSLHVCNAPSPAATSAIPIGDYLSTQTVERMPDGGSR
jgi:L-2-hydroxyglutarate oxidase